MRILYLANNRVGLEILRWLKGRGEDIVGLVIHPPGKQTYGSEMLAESGLPDAQVFLGSGLRQDTVLEALRSLRPDIGVSVLFDYILEPRFLALFPHGCLNLHPAYLPYNRGQYPNVWSLVEGTPAGATLHYIDSGIDTGDIVAQQLVPAEPVDTGETLYRKLERACVELFHEAWPKVKAGQAARTPQAHLAGTSHRTRDVDRIDPIDLDRLYVARDLINILRARTFPPYPGAYFHQDGRRVYLRLQLFYEEDLGVSGGAGRWGIA